MRILVLSNLYPPNIVGGYERLCFEVASALAAQGHEITVLTSRYGGKVTDYPGQVVIREWDLLTGSDIYVPFGGTAEDRNRINRSNVETLRRVVDQVSPDVVFAWNLFFLDASVLDTLEQVAVRSVVMLTDNWLLVMRNPRFVADFFRTVVHGGAAFTPPEPLSPLHTARRILWRVLGRGETTKLKAIFGSRFVRDLYAAGGSVFPRHRVIHNGVRQQGYRAVETYRTRLVQPGTLRLLFAGRLVDLKGAHTAVAALGLLDPATLGLERIQLTLLGDMQDKAYMVQLEEAIQQSGRASDIGLEPPVPEQELPSLFARHDVYLFPSLYEPFSLTLIHALALGIPTIASRAGGNVEIVRDGESGLLFDPGDAARLAACVRRLAGDGPLRQRLSVGGQRVARSFTFERMVGEMAEFLSAR